MKPPKFKRRGGKAAVAIAAILLQSLAALSCRAEDLIGAYTASWAGLPAASIVLSLDDSATGYRDELRVATEGLPRWFTHFRTDVTVDGAPGENGNIRPLRYDALYDLRKRRNARISMRFVSRDGIAVAERGAADTGHKPLLPGFYRANVIDPLSALAVMRGQLRTGSRKPGRTFRLPIYDGARRFDAIAQVQPSDPKEHLIHLKLTLVPIAGFKGETSEDGDPDSAPRPLDVAFSDDARLLPVYMKVSIAWLPFVVRFDHACAKIETCMS